MLTLNRSRKDTGIVGEIINHIKSDTCPRGGMVDTLDSKSSAERRVGSSPTGGTEI